MNRNTGCTLCPLHTQCRNVCIPTVRYPLSPTGASSPPKDKAILILGEAPGAQEDVTGEPFVGHPDGPMLKKAYIDFFNLSDLADVYLGYAVRCRPPRNDTPKKAQIKACREYLLGDIETLVGTYKDVAILACGAVAAQACGFKSLKAGLSNQGKRVRFQWNALAEDGYSLVEADVELPVYSTNRPSYLVRNPSGAFQVRAHLTSFVAHLKGEKTYLVDASTINILEAPPPEDIQ